MASIKVCVTSDYEKFELHPFNRDVRKTKGLEESMRKHGWIDAYPMHVRRNGNGKFKIIGGHTRFTVARMLGIPVKYVVCDDDASIYDIEKGITYWNLEDYLVSFARVGKESYIRVLDFHRETGIGIADSISMLGGQTAGHNNFVHAFKTGAYKTAANTHAYIVADIVKHCKQFGIPFSTNYLFVQALSRIVQVKGFKVAVLKHKIETFRFLMEKQPTLATYQEMIERVYNRKNNQTLPLAFLADKAAKERNVIKARGLSKVR